MDSVLDTNSIDVLVGRVFSIEDITLGTAQQSFVVRYRGRLVDADSSGAYDRLAEGLIPHNMVPLFRIEEGQQIILIERARPTPRNIPASLNLLFFFITFLSVVASGGLTSIESLPSNPLQAVLLILKTGWPFAAGLIAILATHEFGHYLAGRANGAKISLPFFIPLPLSPLGTMGAFINMHEAPRNRRVLMDIAVAGPISGYVMSLAVLAIGLSLSGLDRIPMVLTPGQLFQIEGNSLTYLAIKFLRFGQLLPQPISYDGVSPVLYWLRYFFTGHPLPMGGLDVMIHPVAWAGWVGLLITSINLIPAGQLDGGHIFFLLFGKKHARRAFPVIVLVLIGLGFTWGGWWLWAALVFLFGRVYAEPRDQITPLANRHKALGVLALVIFILTITPIPLVLLSG